MSNKVSFNKLNWEQIRIDCKYPESDQNEGYIFGYEIVQNGEILDIEWFKTEEERDEAMQNEII